jgi:hypothetical protein
MNTSSFGVRRVALVATCLILISAAFWAFHRVSSAGAQEQNALSLSEPSRVSSAHSDEDITQIWVAADPSDARYLIACGFESFPHQNVSTGYVYSTADSGRHWRRTILENGSKFVSEEACTYASDGRAYFAAGESDTSTGEPRHEWGHLILFTSGDHGISWTKTWSRKDGWIDWTSLAAAPATHGSPSVVIFGNSGTDKLGHWWQSRPVAIDSHDGGRSFSNLLAPRPPPGFHYLTVWTSGSVVLPDGTDLFATSSSVTRPKENPDAWWHGHLRIEIFAYSPSTGVRSRAVVRALENAGAFTVTLAQDASHGHFGGRLYTAWVESSLSLDGTGVLWFGTSDDRGYHWSVRPVSTTSCVDDIKVAVAPDGTLGIVWVEDSRRMYVAISRDGGRTFSRGTTVLEHGPGALAITDAVAFNEYWAGEVLAAKRGKSMTPYTDMNHLGVSIRMGRPAGLGDFAVVADAGNTFQAWWAQAEPDGTHGLFARTIRIGSETSPVTSALTGLPAKCVENGENVHPPLPGITPALRPAGQRDISRSFFLRIQDLHYDNATQIVSAKVVLMNKGKTVVHGPLSFFGVGLHSDYGAIAALNAKGVVQSQPFWDASSVIPADGLRPGTNSKPLALQFKITKFQPLLNNGRGGDAAAMLVRIYQRY